MGQPVKGGARRERPLVNDDNAYFWDGIAHRKVLIQRCTGCGELRHPSSPSCPRCRSLSWDTVQASGRGVIYSFTVIHQPAVPGLPVPNDSYGSYSARGAQDRRSRGDRIRS
jgi:uncharacterized OB-fold protein